MDLNNHYVHVISTPVDNVGGLQVGKLPYQEHFGWLQGYSHVRVSEESTVPLDLDHICFIGKINLTCHPRFRARYWSDNGEMASFSLDPKFRVVMNCFGDPWYLSGEERFEFYKRARASRSGQDLHYMWVGVRMDVIHNFNHGENLFQTGNE